MLFLLRVIRVTCASEFKLLNYYVKILKYKLFKLLLLYYVALLYLNF